MALRGVLFDFGYTLFAHESLAATIRRCAWELGVPVSDEAARTLAGRIDAAAMTPEEIAHPRDLDATVWTARWTILYALADEVTPGLGQAINASMHDPLHWVPYATTVSTLQQLHQRGVRVGVVSNTGWDVRAVFAAHGLTPTVDSFTLSYEAGAVKPQPEIFRRACDSLALPAADVLMVGDDPRSDSGAVRVGIATLLLPPPDHPGDDNGLNRVLALVR